jgi:glutathione S-transferase
MSGLTLVVGNKNYSSWSLRPYLVLAHTGVAFETVVIPLYLPETKTELARYTPSGKVPVLIHGATTIWESLAICEYVAEQFPDARLWPDEPNLRAEARALSSEMHAGFSALRRDMPMNLRGHMPGRGRSDAALADAARIHEIWNSCRTRYAARGSFLFGRFSIADAMFAPVVFRFRTYEVEVSTAERAYMDAIVALPAMQAWHADAEREPWTMDWPIP